jgi:hypothetical protein
VAAYQEKEVMEVAEDAERQAAALLQAQSVDISTIESIVGPFLGPYHATVDLVASADDAAMAEAYVVGMVVPQEQPDEEDDASDDIEFLFGDSSDGDVVVSATWSCRRRWTSRWRCSPPSRPRTVRRARASSWLQSGGLSRPCSWCAPAR